MKNLIVFLGIISLQASAGTSFKQSLHLQSSFNPDQARVLELENFCNEQAPKIAEKVKAVAASQGIDASNWKIESKITKNTSATTGDAYYCLATISGDSTKNIKVVELHGRVDRLKTKGFSKEQFSDACEGFVKAYNSNKDELWSAEKISFTSANGNFCDVKSFVLVSQN